MTEGTRIVGQVYPWDIADDPGRPHALQDAGIGEVAVAANYHSVRTINWVNGNIPKVVHQRQTAYYPPIDESAWADSPLRPSDPGPPARGSFMRSVRRANEEGLGVRVWLVLAHDDAHLAIRHPELATVDAWGNRSTDGLCISQADVVEYARRLVEQTVLVSGIRELLIESVTPPGFDHPVSHDKADNIGLTSIERLLLSLCFCGACARRASEDGWDSEEMAATVRSCFDTGRLSGTAAQMIARHLSTRSSSAASLCEALTAPVAGQPVNVTIAATTATRGFSPYASLQRLPVGVTGLCAHLSSSPAQALIDLARWGDIPAVRRAATVNLGPLDESLAQTLAKVNASDISTIVDEIYLYHVGLRRPDTLRNLMMTTPDLVLTGEK